MALSGVVRPGGASSATQRRAIGVWLALGITLACLTTAGGSMTTTDAVLAYDVTRSMVERRSLSTTDERLQYAAYRGRGGQYYSPFGVAQSVWNVPFYVAGRATAEIARTNLGGDVLPKAAVALATVPAIALMALACFALLLELDAPPARAVFTVLLLVFGTPLWPYSGFGFNQPLAGMFLWLAVLYAVVAARHPGRTPAVSGAFAGLAMLTRHEMILAAAIVGVWIAFKFGARRGPAMVSYLLGLVPFVAIWCGLNWWRFGHPLESGYLRDTTPQFGSSILTGGTGLLFSPYASLFLYCPLAVLSVAALAAVWRHNRSAAILMVGLFVAAFTLYASLGNWMGGRSYGPRYLVPVLPALVLPLAFWSPSRRMRRVAAVVVVLSIATQIPGVLVDYSKVREERAASGETVAQDMRWSGMPLLLNARAAGERVPAALRHLAGLESPPDIRRDVPLSSALASTVDLWWMHLFYLNVLGRGTALLLGLGLATGAVVALRQAFVLARACPTGS